MRDNGYMYRPVINRTFFYNVHICIVNCNNMYQVTVINALSIVCCLLSITTKDLLAAFDKGKQVDMSILDFSKAFDVVPHHQHVIRLEHYGMRG